MLSRLRNLVKDLSSAAVIFALYLWSIGGVSVAAAAVTAPSKEALKTIENIDKRYRTAQNVSMDVEKYVKNGTLGDDSTSKGTLVLASGKLKIQYLEPEKSVTLIDGKFLWVETPPSKEFPNSKFKVAKLRVSGSAKEDFQLLKLISSEGILGAFSTTGVDESVPTKIKLSLTPKGGGQLTRLNLIFDINSRQIEELQFWDKLDNTTRYRFTGIKFDQKISKSTFKYTPPKGATVEEF